MAIVMALPLLTAVCFVIWFIWKRLSLFRVLRGLGIRVADAPNFVAGNLLDIQTKGLVEQLMHWTRKNGNLYGFYEGSTPIVVVADAKTARQVLVTSFSSCHARKTYPLQEDPDTMPDTNVFLARGSRWKRLRCITNPAFSINNLKKVFPKAMSHVATLMKKFHTLEGQAVDIHDLFHRFTLDTFFDIAFGFSLNALDNPNDSYLQGLRTLIRFDIKNLPYIMILDVLCAELNKLWIGIAKLFRLHNIMKDYLSAITNRLNSVIESRRNMSPEERPSDLLQMLLDAEVSDESDIGRLTASEAQQKQEHRAKAMDKIVLFGGKKLSIEEVKSSSTLLLLAGFETTGNSLAFFTREIAQNPRVQQKIVDEIRQTFTDDEEITWDKLQSMRYLEQVIKETLRMYPIAAPLTNRMCMENVKIGDVTIPAGMTVQVDVLSMHYDPNVWGPISPFEFYPERFENEKQNAQMLLHFMPYGLGPRQCIGMRFAQIEMKACIVNLLRNFEIRTANPQEAKPIDAEPTETASLDVNAVLASRDPLVNPIAGIHPGPTLSPKGGVHVVLFARESLDNATDSTIEPVESNSTIKNQEDAFYSVEESMEVYNSRRRYSEKFIPGLFN